MNNIGGKNTKGDFETDNELVTLFDSFRIVYFNKLADEILSVDSRRWEEVVCYKLETHCNRSPVIYPP